MDLVVFCTAFIVQFVGHRVGDYLFQTEIQAINKAKNFDARVRHCLVYASTIALLLFFFFGFRAALAVFALTLLEHIFIDSRKPIVAWKNFIERTLTGNKNFDIEKLPFFVLIEIDQTVHFVRIFILSIALAYGLWG